MSCQTASRPWILVRTVGTALLLGGLVASCGSAPNTMAGSDRAISQSEAMPQTEVAETAADALALDVTATPLYQVKTAQMTLELESVTEGLTQIRAIAQRHQGDITGLQNQTPTDTQTRHTAWVELRIPQANLNDTLDDLADLGTVAQTSIAVEDVSAQLVDYEARLKNLRQTEAMLLDIMERSGDMADVLRVTQELSTVRQAIETLDAQQSQLRSRIAYSTINLDLRETTANLPANPPLLTDLNQSWQHATHSVRQLTIGLLKLLTWLAAYSPYLFVLVLGSWLYLRHRRTHATASTPAPAPDAPES